MLPSIHVISFSDFRANAATELKFVTQERGNLWLTKHRKPVCAVIPMKDADILAALQGRTMDELLHRLAVDRARTEEAKLVDEGYERIELVGKEWVYPSGR